MYLMPSMLKCCPALYRDMEMLSKCFGKIVFPLCSKGIGCFWLVLRTPNNGVMALCVTEECSNLCYWSDFSFWKSLLHIAALCITASVWKMHLARGRILNLAPGLSRPVLQEQTNLA